MSSHLFSQRALGAVAQGLLIPIMARSLGPAEFARYAALMGVMTLAVALADLGVTATLTRERARGASIAFQKSLVRLSMVAALAAGGIVAVLTPKLGYGAVAVAVASALWVSAEVLVTTANGVSVADSDVATLHRTMVARKLLPVVGIGAVFLSLGQLDVAQAIGIMASGNLLALGLYARSGRRTLRGRASLALAWSSARIALPFYVHSVGIKVRRLDVIVVSATGGSEAAEDYAVVSRLVQPLTMLPTSFASALLPHVASTGTTPMDALRRARTILVVSWTIYGAAWVLVPWFIPWYLGPGFDGSIAPLRILLIGLAFDAVATTVNSVVMASGSERFAAAVSVAVGVTSLALTGLGALLYGADGAAVGAAVGFAIHAGVLFAWAVRHR